MPNGFEHVVLNWKKRPYDHNDWMLGDFISPSQRRRAASVTKLDWDVSKILDQGSTPHCVGYAWAGFGICAPVVQPWGNEMGEKIYYQAKIEDGEPQQENGSSTLSGVKAYMHFGALENNGYAWARNLDDILVQLFTKGPVVCGSYWYYDMFNWDADGTVHVGGDIAGGHEYYIYGADRDAQQLHFVNSWGTAFGIGGKFKMGFSDFQYIFNDGGDAVSAVEVAPEPTPEPTPDPTPTPEPGGCLAAVLGVDRKLTRLMKHFHVK
ncbi:MAG TPA: hypothetical protein VIY48_14560 [Candidatus Paceibacterota bacterium]